MKLRTNAGYKLWDSLKMSRESYLIQQRVFIQDDLQLKAESI